MLKEPDTLSVDTFLSRQRSAVAEPMLSVGALLGPWRVTAFLGRGGSAEVYRCVHENTSLAAAAKVLVKDDPAAVKRFEEEVAFLSANALSQFPRFYDSGFVNGYRFAIVELLEPTEIPRTERAIAAYLLDVCDCVAALHRAGFVHRDIKPKNILRRAGGEIVLIDFGLIKRYSRFTVPREDVSIVSDKVVGVGTPGYAAPEQLIGGEIQPAADIHALGHLAHVAFSGKPPRAWVPIIRRATSSIPEQRFAGVEAFAGKIRTRHRPLHILCSLCGAGCILLGWLYWNQIGRERYVWWSRSETVVTNQVVDTVVYEKERYPGVDYGGEVVRMTHHHVEPTEVKQVCLRNETLTLRRPLRLAGNQEYWFVGPGTVDGEFTSAGTNTVVRLKNCHLVNRSPVPMAESGIRYVFERGSTLHFVNQDRPAGFSPVRCDGFDSKYNAIRFKTPPLVDTLYEEALQ